MPKRRGPLTAAEVAALQEQRLRDDPEYRREVERVEAARAERTERLRAAEQPVLRDLASVGIEVNTDWNLYKVPEWLERAIPVLLRHLVLDYPDGVLNGIGSALADKAVRPWWEDLKALYLSTQNDVVRDRLAASMSTVAIRQHYDDLLSFVSDTSLGESRIYFLRPIHRIGNRMQAGRGRAVVEPLAQHSVLGREATTPNATVNVAPPALQHDPAAQMRGGVTHLGSRA